MMELIKRMLGLSARITYGQLVKQGAVILDVRTEAEYETGHIRGSVNIPVAQLQNNLNRLPDKQKAVITCCASGIRSASAKNILESNGYKNVYNAGNWVV